MAYTFRRASRAMAVTSSTTAVAFLANMFSPIMPIKAFGLFAGVIVPANYFLVIMIFPSAVIFYDKYLADKCNCCSKKKNDEEPQEDNKHELGGLEKFFDGWWNTSI